MNLGYLPISLWRVTLAFQEMCARSDKSFIRIPRSFSVYFWIVVVGSITRVLFLISLKPIWVPDSLSYTSACALWATHFFTDGARTPLYPLLLGLAQTLAGVPAISSLNPIAGYIVIGFQCLFGLISSCLIFSTLEKLKIRRTIALTAAIGFSSCYSICLFEQAILTESMSTFAVVFLLWTVVSVVRNLLDGKQFRRQATLAGMAAGCAILVRPDNLLVALSGPALFAFCSLKFLLAHDRKIWAGRLGKAALLITTCSIPFALAWMTLNYVGVRQFRLTTSTGWQMSQAVYNIWDRVPPEDLLVGEILSRSYARRAESNRGDRRDHFWLAFDELTTRSRELPLDNSRSKTRPAGLAGWIYSLPPESSRFYTHRYSAGAVMRPST